MANDLITIEGTELAIREYNGQRVVTFKDIDTVHQRPSGTARRNFKHHQKYFEEGNIISPLKRTKPHKKILMYEIRTLEILLYQTEV